MDENDKGNRCVEQDGLSAEKKISRRNFIATSLGAGAAVLGAGVAIDQVLMGEKNSRNSDSGQSRNSSSPSVRVMPASTYAQSILLGVCPSNLVSLCEEPNVYESAGLSSPESLTITGCYEGDNAHSFIELASSLGPDLILDVGHYDSARVSDMDNLRSETDLNCEMLSFNDHNVGFIVEAIAELVDIELPDEVLDPIHKIGRLVDFRTVDMIVQFYACLGGHADGMYAYGRESEYGFVVSAQWTSYLDLSRSTGYSPSTDTAELSLEDFSEGKVALPDVVFLVNGDAARDYVDEKELGYWRILEPGRLGYVFPVLAGGYLWFDELSQFAKEFVAGAWLSLFFTASDYESFSNFSQVFVDFYRGFYGTELSEDAYASECRSMIEAKLPLDADIIAQAQSEFEKEQKQASEAISDALNDEANRVYSYDELHERYQALCEGFGKEYSDEGFEEYLSACKEEGIYRG